MDEPSEFIIYEDCSTITPTANCLSKESPVTVFAATNQGIPNISTKAAFPLSQIKEINHPVSQNCDSSNVKKSHVNNLNGLPSNVLPNPFLALQEDSVLQDENRNRIESSSESLSSSCLGSLESNGTYKLLLTPIQYSMLLKDTSYEKVSSQTLLTCNSSDNSNDTLVEDSFYENESINRVTLDPGFSKVKKNSQTQMVVKLEQNDFNFDMVEIVSPNLENSSFYEIVDKDNVNKLHTSKDIKKYDKEMGTSKLVSSDLKLVSQGLGNLGSTIIYDPNTNFIHSCSVCNKQFISEINYIQHKKECVSYGTNYVKETLLSAEGSKLGEEKSTSNLNTFWLCLICSERLDSTLKLKTHYDLHSREELTSALLKCTPPSSVKNTKPFSPLYTQPPETKKALKFGNLIENNKENDLDGHSFLNTCKEISENPNKVSQTSSGIPKCTRLKVVTKEKPKRKYSDSGLKSRDPHSCHVCKKVLSSRGNLAKHLIQHEAIKPWICKICGSGFNSKRNHDHHYVQRHTSLRPNICSVCGKGYSNKQALTEHMIFHKKEKEFKCHHCNKSFRTKKCVKRHIQRHESNRKFVCDLCQKAFRVRVDLVSHIRLVHNLEKKKKRKLANSQIVVVNKKSINNNDNAEISLYSEDLGLKKSQVCLETNEIYLTNQGNESLACSAEILQPRDNSLLSHMNGEFQTVNLSKNKDPLYISGESVNPQSMIPVTVTSEEREYNSSYTLTLHNKPTILNQDAESPSVYVMIDVNEEENQSHNEKGTFDISQENSKVMNSQEVSGIEMLPSVLENITKSYQEGIDTPSKAESKTRSGTQECSEMFEEAQASNKNLSTNGIISKVGEDPIHCDTHTQTLNLDILSQTLQFDFQSSQINESNTFI